MTDAELERRMRERQAQTIAANLERGQRIGARRPIYWTYVRVAMLLNASEPTARRAVGRLVAAGVLREWRSRDRAKAFILMPPEEARPPTT